MLARVYLLIAAQLLSSIVLAHGQVHQQIEDITAHIAQHPNDAQLRIQRALLYSEDAHWMNAAEDFNRARELNPTNALLDLLEAQMWHSAKRPGIAYPLVNLYLQTHVNNPAAYALRGKLHMRLDQPQRAAADFSRVVALSTTQIPDMYLQWAHAQALVEPASQQPVHQIIQAGLDQFGPLAALLQFAIEYDRKQQDYQAAHNWLQQLPLPLLIQPFWLVAGGELLELQGQQQLAVEKYSLALTKLQDKKQSSRFNKADQALLERINSLMQVKNTD